MAVFEVLCAFDGVTTIEDGPDKGRLQLLYINGDDTVLINDPRNRELHNVFNSLCDDDVHVVQPNPNIAPYEVGGGGDLLKKTRVGDDLDIHHVPERCYLPDSMERGDASPAIALPKCEHRRIGRSK